MCCLAEHLLPFSNATPMITSKFRAGQLNAGVTSITPTLFQTDTDLHVHGQLLHASGVTISDDTYDYLQKHHSEMPFAGELGSRYLRLVCTQSSVHKTNARAHWHLILAYAQQQRRVLVRYCKQDGQLVMHGAALYPMSRVDWTVNQEVNITGLYGSDVLPQNLDHRNQMRRDADVAAAKDAVTNYRKIIQSIEQVQLSKRVQQVCRSREKTKQGCWHRVLSRLF